MDVKTHAACMLLLAFESQNDRPYDGCSTKYVTAEGQHDLGMRVYSFEFKVI